jgi:NAD(P)-dependent dehydrogenase (short-subunit alcohol dehydrogenase family)
MHKLIQIALLFGALVCAGGAATSAVAADDAAAQKAVLVTGASSGIGRRITEELAGNGHFVYAGARKDEDLAALDKIENVESIRLDVTVQSDIDAAVARITEAGRGLHGIVNNAGVVIVAPMIEARENDVDFVFDVNVYGPYRINKAFAPLLIESKGRTTTIGSISGFLTWPTGGIYTMSKFAVEAYTDTLATELAESGVLVSVIEPGNFRSDIRRKAALRAMGKDPDNPGDLTEEEQTRLEETMARNAAMMAPDPVAEAALHALFADEPKRRYLVTPNQEEAEMTIKAALTRIAQLNRDQPYSYSREEMVTMLEEAMAAP